jgi:5-methylcytosine-specific restriction endonuclease McrA
VEGCHHVTTERNQMITSEVGPDGLRDCFREPILEIFEAASLLDQAVTAHLSGNASVADEFIRAADMQVIGEWLDSLWLGQNNSYRAIRKVRDLPPVLAKEDRHQPRDATPEMKRALVGRDGFHCRLCGIPLIRAEVRKALHQLYPEAARWTGSKATEQHRGLQVMWLQYDHVVVHSRGGQTSMENIVVTCPACNFGRDRYMMSEVGLRDPREHPRSPEWHAHARWDGLERVLPERDRFVLST